jgi:hypothetical protein
MCGVMRFAHASQATLGLRSRAGRILLFDVDSFRVVGSVEAPGWVDDLALMSNDRVCGRISDEMWLGQTPSASEGSPRPPSKERQCATPFRRVEHGRRGDVAPQGSLSSTLLPVEVRSGFVRPP